MVFRKSRVYHKEIRGMRLAVTLLCFEKKKLTLDCLICEPVVDTMQTSSNRTVHVEETQFVHCFGNIYTADQQLYLPGTVPQ